MTGTKSSAEGRAAAVPSRTQQWQGACTPCQFQSIAHPGACGKARVMPHNRRPARNLRTGRAELGEPDWASRTGRAGLRVLKPQLTRLGEGAAEMRACQVRGPAESAQS